MARAVRRDLQTFKRPRYPENVRDLARRAGLRARFERTDYGWDWFVTTAAGVPCVQGDAETVMVWMAGYRRGLEDGGTP